MSWAFAIIAGVGICGLVVLLLLFGLVSIMSGDDDELLGD